MMEQYKPIGSSIGHAEPTGAYEILKNGKRKAITQYREYKQTPAGKIEINQWRELALAAVEADGMTDLFERIMECVERLPWLHTLEDRQEWALESMYLEAYLQWEDFQVIWM